MKFSIAEQLGIYVFMMCAKCLIFLRSQEVHIKNRVNVENFQLLQKIYDSDKIVIDFKSITIFKGGILEIG